MTVTAKEFQLWRGRVAAQHTVAELCRTVGLKRSTLAQQLVRGRIPLSTVIGVARAYGLNPLASLAEFEGYHDVESGTRPPTDAELVSQVCHVDILRLLVVRSQRLQRVGADLGVNLSPFPHGTSVRSWIEAIDPGDLRQQLSARTGIARQNLSAQLTAGKLAPAILVEAARIADVSLTNGLVVGGYISADEAAWPEDARERALARMSDADLAWLGRDRLDNLGKQIRKSELDERTDKLMWENLG